MHKRGKEDKFAKARAQMVKFDLMGRGVTDSDVLKAMGEVRREEFVLEAYQSQAYADGPLPIGMGQTISQPYIVALMTQELRLGRGCEVLEVGTGSGYQTAILSRLAKKVYTIEKFSSLSESAQVILGSLGITNVEFYIGDGSCGWPKQRWDSVLQRTVEWGPCFDRVIITAAVPKVPQLLLEQVVEGGFIIAPVGYLGVQRLVVCEKRAAGLIERPLCEVRFVKLIGKHGFAQ